MEIATPTVSIPSPKIPPFKVELVIPDDPKPAPRVYAPSEPKKTKRRLVLPRVGVAAVSRIEVKEEEDWEELGRWKSRGTQTVQEQVVMMPVQAFLAFMEKLTAKTQGEGVVGRVCKGEKGG